MCMCDVLERTTVLIVEFCSIRYTIILTTTVVVGAVSHCRLTVACLGICCTVVQHCYQQRSTTGFIHTCCFQYRYVWDMDILPTHSENREYVHQPGSCKVPGRSTLQHNRDQLYTPHQPRQRFRRQFDRTLIPLLNPRARVYPHLPHRMFVPC